MDDIADPSVISFPGPFECHYVVVRGRQVPFIKATPLNGGQVRLHLDDRFGLTLSAGEAERFVPFLAHAMAVALGYTAHPSAGRDGPNPRHPFPRMTALYGL
jgi:hypothetical protein